MGSISDYLEAELLDHIFNNSAYSKPATVYLGLSTADPTDDASGLAEPSGNGYVRKAITFSAAATRAIVQNGDVTFDEASGAWGTISHYGIFDAETSGNMMAHGALSASKSVVSGNTPSVASTEVQISFKTLATKASGENISDYLANILLDFAFRNQTFSPPTTHLGYATANLADATTGATVTECADANGYARKTVNPNGGATPTWDLADASEVVDNTHDITQASPSGSWGLITAMFIADSATHGAGNILFYDNNLTEQTPTSGDTVRIVAGSCDMALT